MTAKSDWDGTWLRRSFKEPRVRLSISPVRSLERRFSTMKRSSRDEGGSELAMRRAVNSSGAAQGLDATNCSDAQTAEQLRQWTELEVEIGGAIESGQILPYYQPLVDLRTGIVIGCEVLARWKHPTRGFLPPSEFIPMAKARGHISKLTYALLRQAATDAPAGSGGNQLTVSLSIGWKRDTDPSRPRGGGEQLLEGSSQ